VELDQRFHEKMLVRYVYIDLSSQNAKTHAAKVPGSLSVAIRGSVEGYAPLESVELLALQNSTRQSSIVKIGSLFYH
jgi:hypothetical protein